MATGRVPTTANSPLTAKGDLFGYSTTQARVAVGNNGETLVADSSTSTGLRYTGLFGANKNKIINGDFYINQRSFTSTTTTSTYGFDRFTLITAGDGTSTYSAQTFTPGAAPVAGYEAANFARLVTTGQTSAAVRSSINQFIEDVRTCAGQTVTVSFWAKAASGTPKVAIEMRQDFGSGGSTAVNTYAGQVTLSTSWTRYSVTVAVPSISGKTIGTSSTLVLLLYVSAGTDFNARTGSLGIQTNTFDFWGVQVEAGSVATPFQTATGTIQGELAACQRYYIRYGGNVVDEFLGWGQGNGSTQVYCRNPYPVTMRTTPTFGSAAIANFRVENGSTSTTSLTSVAISGATNKNFGAFNFTKTAATFTAGQSFAAYTDNTTNGYLEWSAEL
jgi:hypothetical protein